MPNDVKAVLSVVVLIVAAAFAYYESTIGNGHLVWFVLGTGVFMVLSMWVFPEAVSKKKKSG